MAFLSASAVLCVLIGCVPKFTSQYLTELPARLWTLYFFQPLQQPVCLSAAAGVVIECTVSG